MTYDQLRQCPTCGKWMASTSAGFYCPHGCGSVVVTSLPRLVSLLRGGRRRRSNAHDEAASGKTQSLL